jgi:hypothetical protein
MSVAVDINETCLTVAEVAERLKLGEEMARPLGRRGRINLPAFAVGLALMEDPAAGRSVSSGILLQVTETYGERRW